MSRKYFNVPVVWYSPAGERVVFDSKLEFRCFEALRLWMLQVREIHGITCELERQVPILIKQRSSNYPEMYWKADFVLFNHHKEVLAIVEAKGFPTDKFKSNLWFLDLENPCLFNRTIIVGTNEAKIDRAVKMIPFDRLLSALNDLIIGGELGQLLIKQEKQHG
ncbi:MULTISPECIES: hypothetical protein [Aerosakkonema]|uniref:hypothetical protein n=1 Tax=Aerosakkonema TaxID=1246629 RepID=UPI0035B9E7BC